MIAKRSLECGSLTAAFKSGTLSTALQILLLAHVCSSYAFANPTNRFHGGSFDGHDRGFLYRYDAASSPQSVSVRFHGGSYDGYDRDAFHRYDAGTSPQGVSVRFHGGSYDGYDGERVIQYAYATSPQFIGPRFQGGSYDGYDRDGAEGLTSPLLYDSDTDGLVDWWELVYFDSLAILYGAGDYDGDGTDETTERAADTNPTNASSVFQIIDIEQTNSFNVTFSCTNSRLYSLQSSESLATGDWSLVVGQTNVPGEADGTMSLLDTNETAFKAYRIRVMNP